MFYQCDCKCTLGSLKATSSTVILTGLVVIKRSSTNAAISCVLVQVLLLHLEHTHLSVRTDLHLLHKHLVLGPTVEPETFY